MKRLAVLALLALLYLPALGSSSAGTHPDEAYYLGISAEMDAQRAWLTPTLDGEPRWFKPPLLYWAERLTYGALGRNLFAARLPVALCAIGLALVTGELARRMFGDAAATSAALLCGSTLGWVKFGRIAMMDAPMALALAVAALGAWRAAEEDRPRQLWLTGLGAGAAFMLKGPVGAVLVLLIAGGFLALRRPGLLATRHTAAAFGLGAAVGLPWYVVSLQVHGRRFYEFFVVQQNLDRFRHPWTVEGEATLLLGLLVFLLPWTPLALGGLPPLRRWREAGLFLPLCWMGAVLLVFSVPSLKWPHYGLACAPAAALLACRRPPPPWARAATASLLGLVVIAALLALRFPFPWLARVGLLGAALAFAAGAVLIWRGWLAGAAAAAALGFASLTGLALPVLNPPAIPDQALARVAGRPLTVFGQVPGLYTLAARRPVHRVDEAGAGRALAMGQVVLVATSALAKLPTEVREHGRTVATWQRIRPYLDARDVAEAWRRADLSPVLESMLALAREG